MLLNMTLCHIQSIVMFEHHFSWPVISSPDHLEVQYRTKVVKYTWPRPYHVAESIPWVQVTLANGKTLQTKLLVRTTQDSFIRKTSKMLNGVSFRLALMVRTQWCGEKLASLLSNGTTTSQLLSLFCICLRYDDADKIPNILHTNEFLGSEFLIRDPTTIFWRNVTGSIQVEHWWWWCGCNGIKKVNMDGVTSFLTNECRMCMFCSSSEW